MHVIAYGYYNIIGAPCNNRTHLQTEVSVNFKQLHSEVKKCLGHITLKLWRNTSNNKCSILGHFDQDYLYLLYYSILLGEMCLALFSLSERVSTG